MSPIDKIKDNALNNSGIPTVTEYIMFYFEVSHLPCESMKAPCSSELAARARVSGL